MAKAAEEASAPPRLGALGSSNDDLDRAVAEVLALIDAEHARRRARTSTSGVSPAPYHPQTTGRFRLLASMPMPIPLPA